MCQNLKKSFRRQKFKGYGYIGARKDTTQQSGQTADKEVEMQNITVYVSGYTETGTTGILSPSTDGEYFTLCEILTEFPGKFREYYRMNIKNSDYILDSVKDTPHLILCG